MRFTVFLRFADVPMPPRIAARPADDRGLPGPRDHALAGRPAQFALSGPQRPLICAAERRCSAWLAAVCLAEADASDGTGQSPHRSVPALPRHG